MESVAGLVWRLLEERYPAAAAWWGRPVVNWWPAWTAEAFAREEQQWLKVAEAGETEGTEAARRWARQARHAVLRLRGGVYARADVPLWRVRATLAVWHRNGQSPAPAALQDLSAFLEQAARLAGVDAWTRMRLEALAPTLQRLLRRLAKPVAVDAVRWAVAVDRVVATLADYADRVRGRSAPPPVPWLHRLPEPEPFEAERRDLDATAWAPRTLAPGAVREGLRRLAAAADDEPTRKALAAVTPAGPVGTLADAVQRLWADRWGPLDLALADPRALPGAVDWLADALAAEPGTDQGGWRWVSAGRRALGAADASLWLVGEDPDRVWRWLARYVGEGPAAWWVAWFGSEPGWALSRRLWRDLHGLVPGPLGGWTRLLAVSPADQPPYWQWTATGSPRPDGDAARVWR
ncbi:MAG: hypothetical protein K6V97_15150 [Actinomycetia bacterium]|nr:hypothetical protein [Actinomycetes bacterium]